MLGNTSDIYLKAFLGCASPFEWPRVGYHLRNLTYLTLLQMLSSQAKVEKLELFCLAQKRRKKKKKAANNTIHSANGSKKRATEDIRLYCWSSLLMAFWAYDVLYYLYLIGHQVPAELSFESSSNAARICHSLVY
uniref:Uncharacterized protein n=1 Tax=Glossina austeni TaxID=7395 RepID=A0A1A9UXD8_GLOAU